MRQVRCQEARKLQSEPNASKWQTVSDVYGAMKTKAAKQPKQAQPVVRVKDLKPRKNASGGAGNQLFRYFGDSNGDDLRAG